MFGYVTINPASLPEEERARFRARYCGLCHALGKRHGSIGRTTLSYDMTFLSMLLNSLYEPDSDEQTRVRCPTRPWKKMDAAFSEAAEYAADMNIAYAYFKAKDDIDDDNSLSGRAMAALLKKRYARVREQYPKKCERIEDCIRRLSEMERTGVREADPPANCMGELFAEVYAWKADFWEGPLRALGGAIGRFIYLCDAWEDRVQDEAKGRYNPLSTYAQRPDYEDFVQRVLTMLISEGAQAFELLPLVTDAGILRNILYSGIWGRYSSIRNPQPKPSARERAKRLITARRKVQRAKRRAKQ